jgi:hypothetical protein
LLRFGKQKYGEKMTPATDIRFYVLHISGTLDADFLASYCPAGVTMTVHDHQVTLANLRTDQAGVLGIIRQLHNFGCILLALSTGSEEDLPASADEKGL